ncbi:MAG: site-specific DNA-methyltransferase [Pseudomonadota bacterium]|nr:site-specific DNA-methyltransferase [Pseudomonadota bacterium]
MACAIEDAGFQIRDQIMWIYGSGFPKSRNLQGEYEGWGTALKPAHEPIVLARKPLIGSVTTNVNSHGTGAINIDGCRVPTDEAPRAGAGVIPMRHDPSVPRGRSGEVSAQERYVDRGATNFAATPGPRGGDWRGRWPANVVHDGSDQVLAGFPFTRSGHLPADTPRGATGNGGKYGNRAPITGPEYGENEGSAARFFYCAKASKADRDEGMEGFEPQAFVAFQTANGTSGKASSISEGRDTEYRNTHPTVKPTALMRWLVRLVTPADGLVLDPFMGSGSTGKAAILEGFRFVGCELTADYMPIAQARIEHAAKQFAEANRQGALFLSG